MKFIFYIPFKINIQIYILENPLIADSDNCATTDIECFTCMFKQKVDHIILDLYYIKSDGYQIKQLESLFNSCYINEVKKILATFGPCHNATYPNSLIFTSSVLN